MIPLFGFLLLVVATSSAMPDECFSGKMENFDTLKATHFMSHCLVMTVLEESATAPDEEELSYGPKFGCTYRSLKGLNEDESMTMILTCLLQSARRGGDPPHLNPTVVLERIASAGSDLYSGVDDEGDCTPEKLEKVTYREAKQNLPEYGHCIVIQTLKDLTHPEDLEEYDF